MSPVGAKPPTGSTTRSSISKKKQHVSVVGSPPTVYTDTNCLYLSSLAHSMMKRVFLLLICGVLSPTVYAQDTNEFQRIARRIMDAYDVGEEAAHAPDSAHLYGGAYLGASSNGRAMPSGYVTYLTEKMLLTSQLSVDISELYSEKDITTTFTNGADQAASTDMLTRYEKLDFSARLDLRPNKRHIFSFGILESLDHKRVDENTVKNGHEADGSSQESLYEEQRRTNRDLKLGSFLQYIRDFEKVGRFTTRINLKYNYMPTTVASDTWAAHSEASLHEQRQTLYNFDPYAMLRLQTEEWNGLKLGIEEKYTLEDMRINDTETTYNFNTYSSLTSLSATYSYKWLSLDATFRYEHFLYDVDDHQMVSHDKAYDDWMLAAKAIVKVSAKRKFALNITRDVLRPTYTQLYPLVHIGSGIGELVVGNPALSPSKDIQLKGSYTYSGDHWTHTHSLTYKLISNDISQVSSFDEVSQRPVKTWINDARYSYLRYAAEGEMRYGRYSMTMGFHTQRLEYSGENVSDDDAWSYSFKSRPQLQLPGAWTLATVLLFTGRETHRYYYYTSNLYWSLRAVKQIGDWSFYAFVQDIIQPNRKQILTNDNQSTATLTKPNTRCLIVGCSYTF